MGVTSDSRRSAAALMLTVALAATLTTGTAVAETVSPATQGPPSESPASTPVTIGYTYRSAHGGLAVGTLAAGSHDEATALLLSLDRSPGVTAANVTEPMHLLDSASSLTTAVDPLLASQWGLQSLAYADDWRFTRGARVVVAVVDDGVDFTHPDLRGALLTGRNMAEPNQPVDAGAHGTHVAGIIGARVGNGIGGSGLSPSVTILPVDVFDGSGANDATVAAGIIWAAQQPGVSIINLSLGGDISTPVLRTSVAFAVKRGVLVVAAAGNEGDLAPRPYGDGVHDNVPRPSYPASYPNVLGVGAIGQRTTLASFSSIGSQVDVVAPGVRILSTSCRLDAVGWRDDVCPSNSSSQQPTHTYEYLSGTSMASPFVAATAALLKSRFPRWSASRITSELERTARDLGAAGRDPLYGYGLVQPLTVMRGVPGSARWVSGRGDSAANTITARWGRATSTGAYGIRAWRVAYSLDGGVSWSADRSLPFADNTCVVSACSTTFSGVEPGTLVTVRVTAVAKVTVAAGLPATTTFWHGPDAGGTVATAIPLELDGTQSGAIRSSSDADWFRFGTSASPVTAPFEVDLTGTSEGQTVSVYALDGEFIRPEALATGPADQHLPAIDPSLISGSPTGFIIAISGTPAPADPYTVTVTASR